MSDITMDCCICLETLVNTNITTTPCGHTFCFSCLMKSMDLKNTCPYCRTTLREEEDIIEESDDDEFYDDATDMESSSSIDSDYNWVLNWEDGFGRFCGLDNTVNPTTSLASVDEIMKFAEDNNITMRDIVCATFWRYDSRDNGREIEKKSKKMSKYIANLEKERRFEWDDRQGMMEEDLRRHNRTEEVTFVVDRHPDRVN